MALRSYALGTRSKKMNTKQKIFAILAALFLFGFTYRRRKGGNTIPQTNNGLKNKLIEIATREKELWQNGTIKENNPAMLAKLRQYWGAVGQGNKAASAIVGDAWSAAFISWVMREAGIDWQPAARHSTYFQWAKQNRANNTGSWKAYRLNEADILPGDLVGYRRQAGVNYDTPGDYAAHSDIVVSVTPEYADTIGGNISDSVKVTRVPLRNGKIDEMKMKNPYFIVLKYQK